jgi:hypothetical protein
MSSAMLRMGFDSGRYSRQNAGMTAVRYPIAQNAEAALSRPSGRAARAGDAETLAGAAVAFVQEMVGPAFATREAALDAFAGRVDDERPGRSLLGAEDRYCALREVLVEPPKPAKASSPLRPTYRDGRRWPTPRATPATVWRLSISYWRVSPGDQPKAPEARGDPASVDALRERLERPLRSQKLQKSLDIGLFEVRPPEAPHILMPDE